MCPGRDTCRCETGRGHGMGLTWGLFHTLATSVGPGAAVQGPLALCSSSQAAGARPARAEGRVSAGHGAGAALSCPENLSLPYCCVSPPANTLCHLPKIPSVLLERCSLSARCRSCAVPAGEILGALVRRVGFVLCKASQATNPCPCFQRQCRKDLETVDSQGSDAVWFGTPLILIQ